MITHSFYRWMRRQSQMLAIAALAALGAWTVFPSAVPAHADTSAVVVSAASGGASIYDQNGGSVLQSFSPALSSLTTQSASSSVSAYYGVEVTAASSTPNVRWQITVNNAAHALGSGDVSITQKGYFDASGHSISDSAYSASQAGSDLVFDLGPFSLNAGDDVTDVDQISFSSSAPLGAYTLTRELVDASGTPMSNQYVLSTDLQASGTTTSTTTTPVIAPHDDVTATATTSAGVIVDYTLPTVTDSLDASTTATCTPPSGSLFAVGTTTVACNATDSFGNSASSTSFRVIVSQSSSSTATSTGSTASSTAGVSGPNPNIPPAPFSGGGGGLPALVAAGLLPSVTTTTNAPLMNTTIQQSTGLAFGVGIFRFGRTLMIGDQGDDVAELQARLGEMQLFGGPETGYYGSLTARAVAAFQASLGLQATGAVGPETLLILNSN